MRLSEERIHHLANKMAKEMIRDGAVDRKVGTENLATLIAQVMINDLRREDEIDEEVRGMLARQRNLPPQGTGEYEAMFQKLKQDVAAKRGYPL
ncbi:DUF507 family protein [bacterium]|nr:DUF507 family protein [bacterium]